MSSAALRISYGQYEGNKLFSGMGYTRFCVSCGAHRPYSAGGKFIGKKGSKVWVCKLHVKEEK